MTHQKNSGSPLTRFVERLSTVLVMVVALLLAWRLVEDRLTGANNNHGMHTPNPGRGLNIPDVQYGAKATLVLALSTNCHFCQQSVPFYQRLVKMRSSAGDELKIVAVLPQDESSSSTYLKQQGITVDRLFSKPLSTISVRGTPTLILLDAGGKVLKSWPGLLNAGREKEVLSAIQSLCKTCTAI